MINVIGASSPKRALQNFDFDIRVTLENYITAFFEFDPYAQHDTLKLFTGSWYS